MKHQILKNELTAWRCVEKNKLNCDARVHTKNIEIVAELGKHNHQNNTEMNTSNEIYSIMKEEAISSELRPISIIAENSEQIINLALNTLPKIESIKRTLRRVRASKNGYIPTPKTLDDFFIPDSIRESEFRNIHIFDSGPESRESRFILLIHFNHIEYLQRAKHIYADGTFYCVPRIFYQLYSFHAKIGNSIYPLAYALLPNKKQHMYTELFKQLRTFLNELKPETIVIDFEYPAINAFKEVFSESKVKGCYFHFNQSIIRKTFEKHKIEYEDNNDSKFRKTIQSLINLATIEEVLVVKKFYEVAKTLPIEISSYFELNYIGIHHGQTMIKPPMFPVSFWNVFELSKNSIPRTNNSIEGWHNHFNAFIGEGHPNVYKLLRKLDKQMNLTTFQIKQT